MCYLFLVFDLIFHGLTPFFSEPSELLFQLPAFFSTVVEISSRNVQRRPEIACLLLSSLTLQVFLPEGFRGYRMSSREILQLPLRFNAQSVELLRDNLLRERIWGRGCWRNVRLAFEDL